MFVRSKFAYAGAALVTATMLAISGCSSESTPEAQNSTDSESSSAWSYTDATGKTVTLDSKPTRIAGFVDQAAALYSYGVKPVAMFGRSDITTDARLDGVDLSGIELLGSTYGEIDIEALAAAQPELIVTGIYPTDREGTLIKEGPFYGFADVEQQKQIEKIAPIVTIEIGGNGLDVMTELAELAESLGADESVVAQEKATFDAQAAALKEVVEQNPDIEVTPMYADADGVYVTKVADEPMTQMYSSLGINLTNLNPDGDYYWDIYSWENVGKMFTGDILLPNNEGLQAEELAKQATFAGHPALAAGQVYEWSYPFMTYADQAESLELLSGWIAEAQDVATTQK